MNVTGLVILAVFLLCVWDGWRKGLVRKFSGIAAMIISSILVWAMLPAVTSFLKNSTPVYEMIVTVCENTISGQFGDTLVAGMSSSGSSAGSSAVQSDASAQVDDSGAASQQDIIVVNPTSWNSTGGAQDPVSAVYRKPAGSEENTSIWQQTSDLSGAQNRDGTYNREAIRSIMNQYGLDGNRLDSMSDAQVEEYVQQYLLDYIRQMGDSISIPETMSGYTQTAGLLNNLTKIEQTRLIQSLPVPAALRKSLLNFNNGEGYRTLGASSFAEYIIRFIANIILNILAFFATMLVVNLIVRAVLSALDMIARIPGIYTINHLGGLAAGAVQGVIVVWVIFLILSLFSGTSTGMMLLEQVNANVLLRPLYQGNFFLKIVTNAVDSIM